MGHVWGPKTETGDFSVRLRLHSSSRRPHSWSLGGHWLIGGLPLEEICSVAPGNATPQGPAWGLHAASPKSDRRAGHQGIREGDRYVYIWRSHGQMQRLTRNLSGNRLKMKSVINDSWKPHPDQSPQKWPEGRLLTLVILGVHVTRMYVKDSRTGLANNSNYLNRDEFLTPRWSWNLELWDHHLSSLVSKERLIHLHIKLITWVPLPQHPGAATALLVYWAPLLFDMCSHKETI